jgi:hypothetical protein
MGDIVKDAKINEGGHSWKFSHAEEQEWGWTLSFYCDNGCPTTTHIAFKMEEVGRGGLCATGGYLEDDDGNFIRNRYSGRTKL